MTVPPIDGRPQPGLILAGEVVDLFSHMALWGLAAICEDAGLGRVRGSWTDEPTPRPVLHVEATPGMVASAVHAHANRRAMPGSWLHETFDLGPGTQIATMAPRSKNPDHPNGWRRLDQAANEVRECLPTSLDERLLHGLGYRSWWMRVGTQERPDLACSSWEMRTRNKGMDMVKDRLLPLATIVAAWDQDKILAGLCGHAVDDVAGNNKSESRSATGFRLPGPVDNARAWCALWGLSVLPVLPSVTFGGRSPAFVHGNETAARGPNQLLMVAPNQSMPLARFEMLQRSEQLVSLGRTAKVPLATRATALQWLQARGATAVLRFPIRVVGSTSAPERQALTGERVKP